MKKKIKVELNINNEENTQRLMAKAIADITRMRIEELPNHLQVKAYDILIEKVKSMK